MKYLAISAAVVGILASGAAAAKHVDIYVSGASAQRNFWRTDLATIANCAAAPGTHTWSGKDIGFGSPDFSFTSCIAGAAPLNPNIATGDTVTLHYSAELGSVWGVVTALGKAGQKDSNGHAYPAQHLFLSFNAADCTGTETVNGTCGNATLVYALETTATITPGCTNAGQDAICVVNPAELALHNPDISVTDLEPLVFTVPDNWPTANSNFVAPEFAAMGLPPSAANVAAIANGTGGGQLNGQVFGVALNGIPGGNPTTISSASLQSIFQGSYTTWNQVPEVGPKDAVGTQITICRRDHGSGTQAITSLLFTGTECGLPNFSPFQAENGTSVILNTTTGKLKACVNGHTGSIGFFATLGNFPGATDTFTIPSIDGIDPNAHNAAAGFYKYSSQTFGANTATVAVQQSLANTFLTQARNNADLGAALGKETTGAALVNGQFQVTAGTRGSYFTLPITGNGVANNIANLFATPAIPNGLQANGGNSCLVFANQNTP